MSGEDKHLFVVLFGPPGSGKGTQAELLRVECRLYHLSTGAIFREIRGVGSALALKIDAIVNSGQLVPDALVSEVVGEKLALLERDTHYAGVLFDGYPRNLVQARQLDATLQGFGRRVDFVFSLEVPEEQLLKRLTGRRVCATCGRNYNVHYNAPKVTGRCDLCAGHLIQREDDREEVIAQRLKVYHEQTTPLLDYYECQDNLIRIQGDRDKHAVFGDIMNVLRGHAG